MLHKMPLWLLLIILAALGLEPFMPLMLKATLFALSLTLKSGIIFLLPFIIFALLFKTAAQLAKGTSAIIGLILISVVVSNFISTMLSYSVGSVIYMSSQFSLTLPNSALSLVPAWTLSVPTLLANDHAMFLGLGLGLILAYLQPKLAHKLTTSFDRYARLALQGIILVMPVFIAGFVVKMCHEGVLQNIIKDYALIFAVITLSAFSYICLLYGLANNLRFSRFLGALKNMLPAAIAGFGTMSSAAAMPLTLNGTEKNSANPLLARSIIPATVNIHLIGDCFAIPIFAFAILKSFGLPNPDLSTYLVFAGYFVFAKFSVAAVPGGGILVMLPILEKHLGFKPEMLSLITALYILFDPVITSANVMGNGAFALLISKHFAKPNPKSENKL